MLFFPCSPFQIRFTFSRSGEIARVSQGKLRQMVEKLGVDIMSLIVLLFVCTLQCTLYIHSNTVLLVLYLLVGISAIRRAGLTRMLSRDHTSRPTTCTSRKRIETKF